jgi:hypothetical protein
MSFLFYLSYFSSSSSSSSSFTLQRLVYSPPTTNVFSSRLSGADLVTRADDMQIDSHTSWPLESGGSVSETELKFSCACTQA